MAQPELLKLQKSGQFPVRIVRLSHRKPRDGSGKVHWWITQADLLKLQKSGQFPDEPKE
jgi:hypothetical protein